MTAAPLLARSTPAATAGRRTGRVLVQLLVVVGASALLGAATSWAQTFLPDALRPFANSASGWTLVTAVVVAACRPRTGPAALLGAAGFVSLVLGYQAMSTLRGFPTSEVLFLVVGVLVGPFVGVAVAWLARGGTRAALGSGLLSGIAVGEGAYGLILVSASTGWVYWVLITAAGVALAAVTVLRGAREPRDVLLVSALTVVVAVAFFFSYSGIGMIAA